MTEKMMTLNKAIAAAPQAPKPKSTRPRVCPKGGVRRRKPVKGERDESSLNTGWGQTEH